MGRIRKQAHGVFNVPGAVPSNNQTLTKQYEGSLRHHAKLAAAKHRGLNPKVSRRSKAAGNITKGGYTR